MDRVVGRDAALTFLASFALIGAGLLLWFSFQKMYYNKTTW